MVGSSSVGDSPSAETCATSSKVCSSSLFWNYLVSILVVTYWRGTWNLLSLWIFPSDDLLSALFSLGIGFVGLAVLFVIDLVHRQTRCCCLSCSRDPLCTRNNVGNYVGKMLLLYVKSFLAVAAWRGIWVLLDVYFLPDEAFASNLVCHAVGVVGLLSMGYYTSTIAAPVVVAHESQQSLGSTIRLVSPILCCCCAGPCARSKTTRNTMDRPEVDELPLESTSPKADVQVAPVRAYSENSVN